MKKSFIEQQHTKLIKRFHTMLGQAGIDDNGKRTMLAAYGVESSKDLTTYELIELCSKLDKYINPELHEANVWRKRLIAAIGRYLTAMGRNGNDMSTITAIACRAAKSDSFNRIPKDRLISLYNAFNKRTRDLQAVNQMAAYGSQITPIAQA